MKTFQTLIKKSYDDMSYIWFLLINKTQKNTD
jgi:hypothetical protein